MWYTVVYCCSCILVHASRVGVQASRFAGFFLCMHQCLLVSADAGIKREAGGGGEASAAKRSRVAAPAAPTASHVVKQEGGGYMPASAHTVPEVESELEWQDAGPPALSQQQSGGSMGNGLGRMDLKAEEEEELQWEDV
jgi:hypothetical protein